VITEEAKANQNHVSAHAHITIHGEKLASVAKVQNQNRHKHIRVCLVGENFWICLLYHFVCIC
jgi:hypothetical protein